MASPYVTDQELLKLVQAARLPGDVAVRLGALLRAAGGGTGPAGPPGPTGATGPAGPGFADGDYGDITISGGVTSLQIDVDAVTNTELANMAAGTIKGRAVGAGSGDPTDLTGTQATAILDVVTSGAKGLAPATGGGSVNFLRADGSWAVPPGTGVTSAGLPYFFATGQDGAAVYDGSTTILGVAPAANVYTLARDILCTNVTVNSGVTVKTNGFRIFATDTVTINGKIEDNGNSGSGANAGLTRATSFYSGTNNGGSGSNGANGGAGTNTGNLLFLAGAVVSTTNLGGAIAGNGVAGNAPFRGGGGGGCVTLRTGGSGGQITGLVSVNNGGATLQTLQRGLPDNSATRWTCASGGGGGGGPAVGSGGGGGAGGGIVFIACRTLTGSGTIEAKGGNGGNATTAVGTTGGGGGGGGGGGFVALAYGTRTGSLTFPVTGGVPGNGSGGGGNGGAGADGLAVLFNLSGDGT